MITKTAHIEYLIFDKRIYNKMNLLNENGNNIFRTTQQEFSLQYYENNNKDEYHLKGYLSWSKPNERPSVGMKLLNLEMEIQLESVSKLKVFQHGYQSWSLSNSYEPTEKDESPLVEAFRFSEENVYTNHAGKQGEFVSEGFLMLYSNESKKGILLYALKGDYNVKFQCKLKTNGDLESISIIQELYCLPEFRMDYQMHITPVVVQTFESAVPEQILEFMFQKVSESYHVTDLSNSKVPTGWCSWYYYYTNITEEIIRSNIKEIQNKSIKVDIFQIDDGYQKEIGDWLQWNHKFPNGLKPLVEEIKNAGMTPGLWLAPFLVRKKSEFLQLYPEAVLKDKKGNFVPALWNPLWGWDYTYCIDVTHPRALEFLEHIFKTLVNDLGFTYLKLDFLYSASLDGVAYDRKQSPYQRYRNAIEFIRKIVGKDIFLLGCGAPIYPSIGIFDGMRIGCDVTSFWHPEWYRELIKDKHALCTERALINTLTRSFMHRRLWLNDPDCLLVGKDRNKMSMNQTITMATVMAMSSGMLLLSDNLTTLDPDRLEIFQKALKISSICQKGESIPIGIFDHKFPRAFYNTQGLLGVWNPTKETDTIKIDIPEGFQIQITPDFWTNQQLDSLNYDPASRVLSVTLEPYRAILLGVPLSS